jgi:energy-coupling factor transport system permease protein
MDNRTGFFVTREGPVQRLNPRTKLAAALLLLVGGFCLPGLIAAPLLFLLVLAPASIAAGVARPFLRTVLTILLPIAISVFIVQGFFFPIDNPTLIPIGPLALRLEGLRFAARTAGRLLVLAGAPLLVLQTTHPVSLVQALIERGLPRSAGYIILVAMQLAPAMTERAAAVADAQQSRGLETQGNLLVRARGLLPLVSPLIVGLLLEVEERALALESRAFLASGPKTTLYDLPDTPAERALRWLMLIAALALLAWCIYSAVW